MLLLRPAPCPQHPAMPSPLASPPPPPQIPSVRTTRRSAERPHPHQEGASRYTRCRRRLRPRESGATSRPIADPPAPSRGHRGSGRAGSLNSVSRAVSQRALSSAEASQPGRTYCRAYGRRAGICGCRRQEWARAELSDKAKPGREIRRAARNPRRLRRRQKRKGR